MQIGFLWREMLYLVRRITTKLCFWFLKRHTIGFIAIFFKISIPIIRLDIIKCQKYSTCNFFLKQYILILFSSNNFAEVLVLNSLFCFLNPSVYENFSPHQYIFFNIKSFLFGWKVHWIRRRVCIIMTFSIMFRKNIHKGIDLTLLITQLKIFLHKGGFRV